MSRKVKIFLIAPSGEQGLYCYTAKEVGEFVENYIKDLTDEEATIVFDLEVKKMSMKEIEELPEYLG